MVPSRSPRTSLLAIALAAGCMAALLVSEDPSSWTDAVRDRRSATPAFLDPSQRRQLRPQWRAERARRNGRRAAHDLRFHKARLLAAGEVPWDDVERAAAGCGRLKCFFLSRSDPAVGYLIWPGKGGTRRGQKAYEYSKKLESEHEARQLLAGPPVKAKPPESFLQNLDERAAKRLRGRGDTTLIVEESRTAPRGSTIFKCNIPEKPNRMDKALNHLIQNGNKGWERTFFKELSKMSSLLDSNPKLSYHMQFMVSLDGEIYQVDMDRTLRKPALYNITPAECQKCFEDAADFVKRSMDQSIESQM